MDLLLAAPLPPHVEAEAARRFGAAPATDLLTPAQLMAEIGTNAPRALLVSSRQRLDAEWFGALPAARPGIIATCSVGVDHIDLTAARAAGVLVTNTPDVLTGATADMTLLLMLGAARRAREYLAMMDRGWRERLGLPDMLGTDLAGKTLAIVGMGRIGQAVAHRARAFGMEIAYHNRSRLAPELEQRARYFADLDEMIRLADVLSLNLPGNGAQIITAARINAMKPGAIFVNSARGNLVDEEALIDALARGHLGAAGLDVFATEPAYDLRLRDLPRAFLMPHMGSATVETRNAMGLRALDNISAFLAGPDAPGPRDLV